MNVNTKNFLRIGPAYMLRRDGEVFDAGKYHPYINYDVTSSDGDWLILEESGRFSSWWQWFYEHTNNEEVKRKIITCIKMLRSMEYNSDLEFELPGAYQQVYEYFMSKGWGDSLKGVTFEDFKKEANEVNGLINQEFLRFRLGGYMKPTAGSEDEIYFRVSSEGFNWFNLIWSLLYNNKDLISSVTVTKDDQALGNNDTIKIKGDMLYHYPIKDFLELPGRPIIEKLETLKNKRIFLKV